jgi:hypothetical protein
MNGIGLKPHDSFGVPMCDFHHLDQHRIGQPAFQIRHHIDLFTTAAAYFRNSPDHKMKEALRNVATQYIVGEWARLGSNLPNSS